MTDCLAVSYERFMEFKTAVHDMRASMLVLELCWNRWDEVGIVDGMRGAVDANLSYLSQHLDSVELFTKVCLEPIQYADGSLPDPED